MASKRPAEDSNLAGQPSIKKVQFEPIQLGPISVLEEMEVKVIQFQNQKLAQRLEQKHRIENELRQRIEQLEKRQTQDDAVLNVVNRYWNQLNEDVRVLLQRFDRETADESESMNENEATTSFLTMLSTWDKEELDEKLANRVQVSKRAVAKVIQSFDRLLQRNDKITLALKGELEGEEKPSMDETIRQANIDLQIENRNLQHLNTTLHEKYHAMSLKLSTLQDLVTQKETEAAELRNQIDDLRYERINLQARNDKLEHHLGEAIEKIKTYQQLQAQAEDKGVVERAKAVTSSVSQKKVEELQKDVEEQRELANNRLQELDKLHNQHRETLKEVEMLKMDIRQLPESVVVETTEYKCLQSQYSVLYNECIQLKTQLDDVRHALNNSKNTHFRQIERMESEELASQRALRAEVVVLEDAYAQTRKEYEMLRIEFEQNLAANEQTGPINREMRHLITSLQNHNTQLKQEVHRYRRKYKDCSTEIPKLKKQIEELETKLGQAETKAEVKEEVKVEAVSPENEVVVKEEPDKPDIAVDVPEADDVSVDVEKEKQLTSSPPGIKKEKHDVKKIEKEVKKEAGSSNTGTNAGGPPSGGAGTPSSGGGGGSSGGGSTPNQVKTEGAKEHHMPTTPHRKGVESDQIRDLKAQLKKATNEQKEMKLLLDMYKGVSKEQRDKVQVMASEKKARMELEDLRSQMKKFQDCKREERKKLADEEATKKIKQLEEQICTLLKQVASQKHADGTYPPNANFNFMKQFEEEALLNEMEVTGQAFEEMQEQNTRLMQQLREKDDANFKLMTERIKSTQLHKISQEEKDMLNDRIETLQQMIESTNLVVRKLEEKERFLQNALATAEKELTLRQQANEMNKRKAIESAQSAADLKLHLEKYHAQMKEAQQVVGEKTSALEAEAYKTRRLQEEMAQLRRKAERIKKIELAGTVDEVLMEEIREYKETLTCSSCKVKRKDAVLSKCFHVFCYDCLRTRYETRQRKCPKCNAAFGANDYHRLYLS